MYQNRLLIQKQPRLYFEPAGGSFVAGLLFSFSCINYLAASHLIVIRWYHYYSTTLYCIIWSVRNKSYFTLLLLHTTELNQPWHMYSTVSTVCLIPSPESFVISSRKRKSFIIIFAFHVKLEISLNMIKKINKIFAFDVNLCTYVFQYPLLNFAQNINDDIFPR